MATFENNNLTASQKIRAALHRDVRSISTESCHFLGLEITKPAMEIIAELVYKKLYVYGTDLELFAKHAKRATINSDDVKLLVRRCPSLKSHLTAITASTTGPKDKRRKTVVSKMPETPITKRSETPLKKAETPVKMPESDIQDFRPESPIISMNRSPKRINNKFSELMKDNDEEFEKMIVDEIDLTFD